MWIFHNFISLLVVAVILVLPLSVFALIENDVKEMTCDELHAKWDNKPIHLDLQWMASVQSWHIPLWSKLDAYRTIADILDQEIAEITENRLGSSCIKIKGNMVYGYGKEVEYDFKADGTSITFNSLRRGGESGKCTFKLTDNKSYIMGITCWEDIAVSWAVMSTTPTLKQEDKNGILKYLENIGFKKTLALQEDYANCKGGKKQIEL